MEVSVSDSGPGIPDNKLADIFDTFYTTKKQGTGLGLSIAAQSSRHTVERSGRKTELWAVRYFASHYPLSIGRHRQLGIECLLHPLASAPGTGRKVSALEQLGQLSWGEPDMTAARLACLNTADLLAHHLNRNRPFRSRFGNGPPLTA